jgi:hypothetical protein
MIYFCSQKNRRALVLQHPGLNGIDYLEVCGSDDPECGCGKQLFLTLLKDARQLKLDLSQLRFSGGAALAQVTPVSIAPATKDSPRTLTINLDNAGDFSTYNLTLIANPQTDDPPDGFDPQLSTVDFSFKAGCPTVGDCVPDNCCPPDLKPEPDINYLAKDYEAFRQVMLDRMAVTAPSWTERHPSDLGIALVEQLASVADHLSYQQDAAGTEAYLGTARSRISLRRHARLVDYQLDEGSNARAWVYVKVLQDAVPLPTGTLLFPRVAGFPAAVQPNSNAATALFNNSSIVFASMQDALLYTDQNELHFYTWSDANCCLAPGATEATLVGHQTTLQPGSVLIFEEVLGPQTGDSQDADPAKRWAVRLTRVRHTDFHDQALVDPLNNQPVTRIYWDPADALPFPLCLSATTDTGHGGKELFGISVARGNIIPADHGLWLEDWEDLGEVPAAPAAPVPGMSCSCGSNSELVPPRPRYYPELSKSPLTFAWTADFSAPASSFLSRPAPEAPRPTAQIFVHDDSGQDWQKEFDLFGSLDTQPVFLVEIERDNSVFLRFGDGQYGMAPETGMSFQAQYRVGNGSVGNIGHDAISHVLTNETAIAAVRNPLPASGGVDPETMEHIRQQAPFAFRSQLRAVTEDDYGTMAEKDPAIREARGTLRWTGSWYTAFISVDATSDLGATPALVATTKKHLNLYRMAGVDLDAEPAKLVGLRIEMNICVDPDFFQTDVRDAILRLFTVGDLCDGTRGLLNPENFTFGQTIYTSPFVAATQEVDGVSSAQISVFQRMDDPSRDGVAQGFLTMGRLEIARCDNNPNRLDRGILVLHMDGGK